MASSAFSSTPFQGLPVTSSPKNPTNNERNSTKDKESWELTRNALMGGVGGVGRSRRRVSYFFDPDIGSHYYNYTHPMKPHRIKMTHDLISAYGLEKRMDVLRPPRASPQSMTAFHTDEYIDLLSHVTPDNIGQLTGGGRKYLLREDDPAFDGLFEFCQISAGGSMGCARQITSYASDIAINWAGGLHHSKKREASGFCYVNDVVLAILELLRHHQRVLYVDIDIHHGDGVEEAFYTTDRVMTCSFHKFGDYFPGTGHLYDIGLGKGKNYAVNIPLKDGIANQRFQSVFQPIMQKIVEWYRPGVIILQSGADSLAGDKLGSFNLTMEGHASCLSFLRSFSLPLILVGGGGYTIRNVSRSWTYETAVAIGCEEELDRELPWNEHIEYYGPEYRLEVPRTNVEDANTEAEIERIIQYVTDHIRHLPFAPSIQSHPVPHDIHDADLNQFLLDHAADTHQTNGYGWADGADEEREGRCGGGYESDAADLDEIEKELWQGIRKDKDKDKKKKRKKRNLARNDEEDEREREKKQRRERKKGKETTNGEVEGKINGIEGIKREDDDDIGIGGGGSSDEGGRSEPSSTDGFWGGRRRGSATKSKAKSKHSGRKRRRRSSNEEEGADGMDLDDDITDDEDEDGVSRSRNRHRGRRRPGRASSSTHSSLSSSKSVPHYSDSDMENLLDLLSSSSFVSSSDSASSSAGSSEDDEDDDEWDDDPYGWFGGGYDDDERSRKKRKVNGLANGMTSPGRRGGRRVGGADVDFSTSSATTASARRRVNGTGETSLPQPNGINGHHGVNSTGPPTPRRRGRSSRNDATVNGVSGGTTKDTDATERESRHRNPQSNGIVNAHTDGHGAATAEVTATSTKRVKRSFFPQAHLVKSDKSGPSSSQVGTGSNGQSAGANDLVYRTMMGSLASTTDKPSMRAGIRIDDDRDQDEMEDDEEEEENEDDDEEGEKPEEENEEEPEAVEKELPKKQPGRRGRKKKVVVEEEDGTAGDDQDDPSEDHSHHRTSASGRGGRRNVRGGGRHRGRGGASGGGAVAGTGGGDRDGSGAGGDGNSGVDRLEADLSTLFLRDVTCTAGWMG